MRNLMLLGIFHCFSLSLQESNKGSEVTVGRYMRGSFVPDFPTVSATLV